jgi:hypothetical protein
MAPRRYFSDQMFNPYFQSEHYKNESPEIKMQNSIKKFFQKLLFWEKISAIAKISVRRK